MVILVILGVVLALVPFVGAALALRHLARAASRWGLELRTQVGIGSYRQSDSSTIASRHSVPVLVVVAAGVAGAVSLEAVALATVILVLLLAGVWQGGLALLPLAVTLPPLLLSASVAVSLGLYLRALVNVDRDTPARVQLAVFMLGVVGVPAVLVLGTLHIGALLVAVPLVGVVLILAAAAHRARDAAQSEAARQQAERDALRG